jgi:hypothetical protein
MCFWVGSFDWHEDANPLHALGLLRAHCKRPCCRTDQS